ncbi:hypothetical protein HY734_03075 [Candidatus Uhrbacteria bacterium]|nr:hypothetical protein [Candidatus Uhrbacteria bacterium]
MRRRCHGRRNPRFRQFNPEQGSLRQWLSGILRRRVIDYWRVERRIRLEPDETLDLLEQLEAVSA